MIGPSGAGKTTYVRKFLESPDIYAERVVEFTKSLPGGYLLQNIPLNHAITYRMFSCIRDRYEKQFITQFPGLLETTAAIIRNSENKSSILNSILREAAWFEFFSGYLDPDETYVIDDGLYQFHLDLLRVEGWNAGNIMDRLPEADKFIYLDTPAEVCLERQESRSRGRASKFLGLSRTEAIKELELMRSNSEEFVTEARNRGIEVEIIHDSGASSQWR